jgi:hypothetical protein
MNTNGIAIRINRIRVTFMAAALVVAGSLFGLPVSLCAQPEPLEIHRTQVQAIEVHRKFQKKEEDWADQKADMAVRYRALQAEEKTLQKTLTLFESRVAALVEKQNEIQRRRIETERLRDTLESHLVDSVYQLEEKIAGGLPFLPLERSERIESVKSLLSQPDVSVAEKCRRVMEVLKVEAEYGYTMEVYQKPIQVSDGTDSATMMVDVLRVGRLAMFWRTPDGRTAGRYDRISGNWVTLPDRYLRSINDAVEVALRRRTIEMVNLPIGRIVHQ